MIVTIIGIAYLILAILNYFLLNKVTKLLDGYIDLEDRLFAIATSAILPLGIALSICGLDMCLKEFEYLKTGEKGHW